MASAGFLTAIAEEVARLGVPLPEALDPEGLGEALDRIHGAIVAHTAALGAGVVLVTERFKRGSRCVARYDGVAASLADARERYGSPQWRFEVGADLRVDFPHSADAWFVAPREPGTPRPLIALSDVVRVRALYFDHSYGEWIATTGSEVPEPCECIKNIRVDIGRRDDGAYAVVARFPPATPVWRRGSLWRGGSGAVEGGAMFAPTAAAPIEGDFPWESPPPMGPEPVVWAPSSYDEFVEYVLARAANLAPLFASG